MVDDQGREVDEVAYLFNNLNGIPNNWLDMESGVKTRTLQVTDDFSVSMWITINANSQSAYIFSYELGTARYFSLFDSGSDRAILYYFRDRLSELDPADVDDGFRTQVAFSFYYDDAIFPNGLRDSQWHFISLNMDFPDVTFTVDGYVFRPTRGNYFNSFNNQVVLDRLQDGTFYQLPAPLLTKSQDIIDSIDGRLGGSARGNNIEFCLGGQIRQMLFTDRLSTADYNCIGSCNNEVFSDRTVSGFTTFYQPATRLLSFSGPLTPDEYTAYLQTLLYSDNGFIPLEQEGESRLVTLQVCRYN